MIEQTAMCFAADGDDLLVTGVFHSLLDFPGPSVGANLASTGGAGVSNGFFLRLKITDPTTKPTMIQKQSFRCTEELIPHDIQSEPEGGAMPEMTTTELPGNQASLSFSPVFIHSYRLQTSQDLKVWATARDFSRAIGGQSYESPIEPAPTKRFFRLMPLPDAP